jgi:hypothetical protein
MVFSGTGSDCAAYSIKLVLHPANTQQLLCARRNLQLLSIAFLKDWQY